MDSYLIFFDLDNEFVINVVPLESVQFIPRAGDTLSLPGNEEDLLPMYEVVDVRHGYVDDYNSCISTHASITIEVREAQEADEEAPRNGSAAN